MKMSERDRLEAIKRCPEFIEERGKLFHFYVKEMNGRVSRKSRALHEKICRKWDIQGMFLYDHFQSGTGLEMLERKPIELVSDEEWSRVRCMAACADAPRGQIPFTLIVRESLFVQLQIDLSKSEKELMNFFGMMIKDWKRNVPKERKARKTEYDKWKIWDLHRRDGISLSAIALRYKRGKKVAEDSTAAYNRVKRAFSQAEKMIRTVQTLYI